MSHTARPQFVQYGWPHFVRRSGGEARQWVDGHYAPRVALSDLSMEALVLMRTDRVDEGRACLDRLRDARERLAAEGVDPALACVVDRWYHAAMGYYFYRVEAWDEADRSMARARDAVAGAVERHRFLLPMAYDCYGFSLHRAQVARNGQRWDAMWAHLDEVRGMMEGRLPFCTLADGTPVAIADIQAFYRALPALDDAEREAVGDVLDDGARLTGIQERFRSVLRIPGTVIPYP